MERGGLAAAFESAAAGGALHMEGNQWL